MTGSGTAEHTPGKYKTEIVITWTLVGVPLAYGIYNTLTKVALIF